jgi:hypothetical protein
MTSGFTASERQAFWQYNLIARSLKEETDRSGPTID